MKEDIIKALNWRYAVQVFDKSKEISPADLETILDSGRLAPSSYGLEAWKFLVIKDKGLRERLKNEAGYEQAKISDSSELIVLARRSDVRENILKEKLERMAKATGQPKESFSSMAQMIGNSIDSLDDLSLDRWTASQVYIALGVMMETASLLGIDSAAMEGFMPAEVDKILGLGDKNLKSTLMLSLGYRSPEDKVRPKVRRELSEVVEYIQ